MNHKSKTYTIIALTFLLMTFGSIARADFVPVGEAGSEIYFARLLRDRLLNSSTAGQWQIQPDISRTDSPPAGVFNYWPDKVGTLRWYFSPSQRSTVASRQRYQGTELLRAGFSSRLSDKVSVLSSFILDEELAKSSNYTGKVWRGLAGGIETGALSYGDERFTAVVGRFRSSWGPTPTNVLFSQEARPRDGLSSSYRLGRKLTFSYHFARLNPLVPDSENPADTLDVFVNRYLAAHRLDFQVSNELRIGVFESVIFAGPGRGLELQYLNPLVFFHSSQLNEGSNDNTFLGFDFNWRIQRRLNLYGQLLVDDFQIEKETQGDQEPDEIGFIVGGYLVNLPGGFDLGLRWDKVTNRTYNQKLERNRYLNQNVPLGHPLGNDFERQIVEIYRWLNPSAYLRLSGEFISKGEGAITDEWTEPWLLTTGNYSESSPTGVVERETIIAFSYHSLIPASTGPVNETPLHPSASLKLTAGWRNLRNANNVIDDNRSSFFFQATFSLFLFGDWELN